jgi:RNA-dependent RNA polymerase
MQRRWTNNPSVYPTASFKAMKALELKPRPIIVRPQPIPFPGPSIGQPVVEVDFGVLGRDGSTYSSEYSVGVKGFLHVNRDGNYLSVAGDGQGFAPARSFRIVISFDAIAAIITPTSSTHPPSIIFELSYAPSLETYTTAARIVRISSFDDEHAFVAPYTTHHLRISLASTAAMHAFLKLVKNLPVPRTVYKDVTVEVGRLYAAEVLYDVRSTLATVNIEDAFQLEAILYDGVIAPVDIEEIVEHLRGYKEEGDMGDKESELVLVELRRMLLEERLARRERDTTPIVDLPLRSVRGSQDLDRTVLELLEAAITTVQDREWLGEQDDVNTFSCRHVSITPSTLILSEPYRESSNAIVRRYPQGSTHYLRVGFVEEDGTRLAVGRRGIDSEFIDRLVLTPLPGLLDLGGRYYEFLGYSQSSIRRHAGYFVAPFPRNVDDGKEGEGGEKEIKASDIRNGFGDLSKIADQPTMYGARLSLGFTSSRVSISLHKRNIVELEDIETVIKRPGEADVVTNHTDGAGTISRT